MSAARAGSIEAQKRVRRRRWVVGALLCGILAGAAVLRLYRLTVLPPGLNFDEGAHGMDALTILSGQLMAFSWEGGGRESLFAYLVAGFVKLVGRDPLAIRLPAALASLLSVAATFGVGITLFAPDSGSHADHPRLFAKLGLERHHVVALLAAALMAFSLNQTILGRTGWRANTFLPLLLLAIWFLWAGMARNHLGFLAGAGLATGLLPYTYIPARLFPVLIAVALVVSVWLGQISWADWPSRRRGILLYLGISALVAGPILIFFLLNPDAFFYRSKYLWIADATVNQGTLGGTLVESIVAHIKAFGLVGDSRLIHNEASLPLLGPVEAVFFWIGLGISVFHWRRPAYRFLLFWFILMIVPGVIAFDNNPPNFLRMIGAIPAAYLFSALGMWHTLAAAHRLWDRRSPALRTAWEMAIGLLLIFLLAGQGVGVYTLYFQQWGQEERLFATYHGYVVDLAEDLEAIPSPNNLTYMTPNSNFNQSGRLYNFEFVYEGDIPVHRFRTADADFPEQLRAVVAADTALIGDPEIRAVNWYDTDAADPNGAMNYLLSKYATKLDSWPQGSYGVDAYIRPMLDRPWSLYEDLRPVSVVYDVGIELTAVAMGRHGGEQFLADTVTLAKEDGPLWMTLAWRATQPVQPNLRLSLRLHNEAGERVQLEEYEMLDLVERPTNEWRVGSDNQLYLIFAPTDDLPQGPYQVRLLIYDVDSLAPAVQVGVWEAELPLLDVVFE